MICIIALIVFSITGLFSATHKQWAKEAFDCVFRRVTLRPCNTGFDQKMKGLILGKLMNRSLFLTKIVNKNFELISWSLVVLTLASFFFSVRGLYNFYMYGSCNGLNQTGFCVFDPSGENNKLTQTETGTICPVEPPSSENINISMVSLDRYPKVVEGSDKTVIFLGCYGCEYSRKAYPLMKTLLERNQVNMIFIHFPAKDKTDYLSRVNYCSWQQDPQSFWRLNDKLFETPLQNLDKEEEINRLIQESGYNLEQMQSCVNDPNVQKEVANTIQTLKDTGIYGTPTIFVKDTVLVGPKPYSVYERILRRWW